VGEEEKGLFYIHVRRSCKISGEMPTDGWPQGSRVSTTWLVDPAIVISDRGLGRTNRLFIDKRIALYVVLERYLSTSTNLKLLAIREAPKSLLLSTSLSLSFHTI